MVDHILTHSCVAIETSVVDIRGVTSEGEDSFIAHDPRPAEVTSDFLAGITMAANTATCVGLDVDGKGCWGFCR